MFPEEWCSTDVFTEVFNMCIHRGVVLKRCKESWSAGMLAEEEQLWDLSSLHPGPVGTV